MLGTEQFPLVGLTFMLRNFAQFQSQMSRAEALERRLEDTQERLATHSQRQARFLGVFGGTLAAIGTVTLATLKPMATAALQSQRLARGAEAIGTSTGKSLANIERAREEIRQFSLTASDANKAISAFSMSQIDLSYLSRLAEGARDLLAISEAPIEEIFSDLVATVVNQSTENLKKYGVYTSTERVLNQYAKSIGKDTGQDLTDQQRRYAVLQYTLKVLSGVQGAYNKVQNDTAIRAETTRARVRALASDMGQYLTPYIDKAITVGERFLDVLEKIPAWAKQGALSLALIGGSVFSAVGILATMTPALRVIGSAMREAIPFELMGLMPKKILGAKKALNALVFGAKASAEGIKQSWQAATEAATSYSGTINLLRSSAKGRTPNYANFISSALQGLVSVSSQNKYGAVYSFAGATQEQVNLINKNVNQIQNTYKGLGSIVPTFNKDINKSARNMGFLSSILGGLNLKWRAVQMGISLVGKAVDLGAAAFTIYFNIIKKGLGIAVGIAKLTALAAVFIALRYNVAGSRDAIVKFAKDWAASFKKMYEDSVPWIVGIERAVRTTMAKISANTEKRFGNLAEKNYGFTFDAEKFFTGGLKIATAFSVGVIRGVTWGVVQLTAVLTKISRMMIGKSPPPEGPLSDIDQGGARVMQAWIDGMLTVPTDQLDRFITDLEKKLEAVTYTLDRAAYQTRLETYQLDRMLYPLQDRLTRINAEVDLATIPLERKLRVRERELDQLKRINEEEEKNRETVLAKLEDQKELIDKLLEKDEDWLEFLEHEIFMEELRNKILKRDNSARLLELQSQARVQEDVVARREAEQEALSDSIDDERERIDLLEDAANLAEEALERQIDYLNSLIEQEQERATFMEEEIKLSEALQVEERLRITQSERWAEEQRLYMEEYNMLLSRAKELREDIAEPAGELEYAATGETLADKIKALFDVNLDEGFLADIQKRAEGILKPLTDETEKLNKAWGNLMTTWGTFITAIDTYRKSIGMYDSDEDFITRWGRRIIAGFDWAFKSTELHSMITEAFVGIAVYISKILGLGFVMAVSEAYPYMASILDRLFSEVLAVPLGWIAKLTGIILPGSQFIGDALIASNKEENIDKRLQARVAAAERRSASLRESMLELLEQGAFPNRETDADVAEAIGPEFIEEYYEKSLYEAVKGGEALENHAKDVGSAVADAFVEGVESKEQTTLSKISDYFTSALEDGLNIAMDQWDILLQRLSRESIKSALQSQAATSSGLEELSAKSSASKTITTTTVGPTINVSSVTKPQAASTIANDISLLLALS